jgi:hypothetical protein
MACNFKGPNGHVMDLSLFPENGVMKNTFSSSLMRWVGFAVEDNVSLGSRGDRSAIR